MRIIHTGGFQLDERKEARQVIFSNLVVAYKIIIEEMKDMGVEFENRQSEVGQQGTLVCLTFAYLLQMFEDIILAAKDIDINDPFPRDCLPAMIALWADGAVQQTIKRGNEYALHDNLK